jgi:cyanophycin synthetase
VNQLPAKNRIGVVTAPGDRRDNDIREIGRLSAVFDKVIVKEDRDRRGRDPGEVFHLIREGLSEKGITDGSIEFVPEECDAIQRAIDISGDEDLVTIMAENVQGVLAYLDIASGNAHAD